MGAAIYPLRDYAGLKVAIPIAVGAVVYAVAVLLLRGLTTEEVRWARRAMQLAR